MAVSDPCRSPVRRIIRPACSFINRFSRCLYHKALAPFFALDATLRVWLALYLMAIAGAVYALQVFFTRQAQQLALHLLPAYQAANIAPNMNIVFIMALVVAASGCLCLIWVYGNVRPACRIAPPPLLTALLCAAGAILLRPHVAVPVFLAIPALLSLSCFFGHNRKPGMRAFIVSHRMGIIKWFMKPCLALPVALLCAITALSWYPIVTSQDYYELPFSIKTGDFLASAVEPGAPPSLTYLEALKCIENEHTGVKAPEAEAKNKKPASDAAHCPLKPGYQVNPAAISILHGQGGWQSAPGRLFFHHSYMNVPARHIAQYGFTGDVPTLYGLGQTAVYALMMKLFGASLGDYFNYCFAFIFIGALLIGLAVYWITRDWVALLCALALSLGFFYCVDFPATFFAAGFTPMRYLGIALQLCSIIFVMRTRNAWGLFVLWLALLLSFFWNMEFSAFGMAGQLMILLSPLLPLSFPKRLLGIGGLIVTLGLLFWSQTLSHDTLFYGNPLSFYKVGIAAEVPMENFAALVASLLGLGAALAWLALRFPPASAHARLCILPVMALLTIKYVYIASPGHLYTTLILSAPFMLIYYPGWHAAALQGCKRWLNFLGKAVLYVGCMGFALYAGQGYYAESKAFRFALVNAYVNAPWDDLNDSVRSVTPDAPIAHRVAAIRGEMKPDDTVLLLSPFDHLLSFYTVPRHFCGHFELLSNMVTDTHAARLEHCALHAPSVLVIYDKAMETPCPEGFNAGFSDKEPCQAKWRMKQTLTGVRDRLASRLHMVKETDDLIFYRIRPDARTDP